MFRFFLQIQLKGLNVIRIVFSLIFIFSMPLFAKTSYVAIGTGSTTGVYYPTGGAIAKMVNKKQKSYGIKANAESTAGSVFNVNAVLKGDLQFGIVQSDRQYQAYNGIAEWKESGPQKKLRSVFSIHPEVITLVAAVDSKITSLKSLKGKRVNIGNHGSGQRGNAIDILTAAGINWEKDFVAESLKASEAPRMVQDSRIDAFFYTVGHPSGAIREATNGKRKVRFIPITGLDKLIKKSPFYAKSVIPKGLYQNAANKTDTPSIGVKATFVSSSDVSEDVVYNITKEIFQNLNEFKKLHPAFSRLTKENMLEALSAPLHPGALKYYREVGLTKNIDPKLMN